MIKLGQGRLVTFHLFCLLASVLTTIIVLCFLTLLLLWISGLLLLLLFGLFFYFSLPRNSLNFHQCQSCLNIIYIINGPNTIMTKGWTAGGCLHSEERVGGWGLDSGVPGLTQFPEGLDLMWFAHWVIVSLYFLSTLISVLHLE